MKPLLLGGLIVWGTLFHLGAAAPDGAGMPAAEPEFSAVERAFRELPIESRRQLGPLFWLHGDDSRARLEQFVGKVAEMGNGAFTTESRPHIDWLGEGWFRDVGICLEAAKRQNLKLWIFDEKWWPSQSVGGRVPPRYAAKRLAAAAVEVTGPAAYSATGYAGARYIGAVAGRLTADGAVEAATLVDLAPFIHEGRLEWTAPAGRWQVMKFSHEQAPGLGQGGGRELSVDGASRDCVEWYLQTVYQAHYDRFGADFGRTIAGFFYDEPETAGDWGTELDGVLAERGVDWKQAYTAWKFRLAGEDQGAARYQYAEARAEAWGRTMYGGITRWCQSHGVRSIGHMMEHAGLYLRQEFCAGDLMRLQKYSSMGGIDAVFSQFKPGVRAAYDPPCWQTPKLGSSVSHAYGKADDMAMVEIFGARGQDLPYPEMKWWADHMQVSGVNFLIPHSFNPRAPHDTDCPPYFFMDEYEPRWPLYRVFANYTSRLSLMLTGGRHVAPVALLFSGNTAQAGRATPPDQLSESLQDSLYDCDWLPFEVFEQDTRIHGRDLALRAERYQVLVVPPDEAMPWATLAKARDFLAAGGTVVGYGFLPSKSATLGRHATEIAALTSEIWGTPAPGLAVCRTNAAGGRSYLLPAQPTPGQIQQVLARDAGIAPVVEVLQGQTDHWLHALHRVKAGRDVFLIANQNHLGAPRSFRLRVAASGVPELWDAMRNDQWALPCRRAGGMAEFDLTLEPNESALVVFQPEARAFPTRDATGTGEWHPLDRLPNPIPPPAAPGALNNPAAILVGGDWVWYPEAAASKEAAPGTRWFRKTFDMPSDRAVRAARFVGTADNSFSLSVNGQPAGHGDDSPEGWRNPASLDVATLLRPGRNCLAIEAVNGVGAPGVANPAGLTGCLVVEFRGGAPLLVRVDASWKAAAEKPAGWNDPDTDDAGWPSAKLAARFGAAPWGKVGTQGLTLGPVPADPFNGRVTLAALTAGKRYVLEMKSLGPEEAARVMVNGQDAGGFIGRPLRLDVTRWLRAGENTVRIEPFAPQEPGLRVY